MNRTTKALLAISSLLLGLLLAACDESATDTASKHVEQALAHRAKGDFSAAVGSLKSALQEDPKNHETRALLGEVYLQSGNHQGAVKELERARSLGAESEQVRLMLVNAWLLGENAKAVLEEIPSDLEPSSETEINLLIARGRALLIDGDLKQAKAAMEKAIEHGSSPDAYVGLALIALEQPDREAAKGHLRQGLVSFPDNVWLLTLLGETLLQDKVYAESEQVFAKAESLNPSNSRQLYRIQIGRIQAQLSQGKNEAADEALTAIAKKYPEDLAVMVMRGFIALQKQDFETAGILSEKVLNAAPFNDAAIFIKGASSFYQGRIEDAHRHLSSYVAKVPSNLAARKLLAMTQIRIGDANRAYRLLSANSNSSDLDADYLELLSDAARLSGHREVSLEALRQAVLKLPEDASIRAKLGLARIATGSDAETAQGLSDLEAATSIDPNEPRTKARLAVEYIRQGEYEKAAVTARELQEEDPRAAIGYNIEAVSFLRRGQMEKAISLLRKAVELEPQDLGSIVNLSGALLQNGDRAQAAEVLESSLEHLPGNLALLLRLAEIDKLAGQHEDAERRLQEAAKANPDADAPIIMLAGHYLDSGQPEQALKTANPAIKQFPRSDRLLEVAGRAQLQLAQYFGAAKTFERLAELRPNDPEPLYLLGRALEARGDAEQALAAKDKALEIAGETEKAKLLLSEIIELLETQEFEAAHAAAKRYQEGSPGNADGFTLGGMASLGLKDPDAAEQAFLKALELQPGAPDASTNLASIALRRGELDRARQVLETSLKHFPDHLTNLKRLAEFEGRAGNHAKTVELLERAISIQPKAASPAIQLGRTYLLLEVPDKALEVTQGLLPLYPDNPALLEIIGKAQLELGRGSDAVKTFDALTQSARGRTIGAAYELLGRAYEAARNLDEAIAATDKALALNPDHPQTIRQLARLKVRNESAAEARELIARLEQAAPQDPELIDLRASLAMLEDRPRDALRLYQKAFEDRANAGRALNFATAQWRMGFKDAAMGTLESWIETAPNDPVTRYQLATYQIMLGRLDDAVSTFEQLLEANPDNWAIHNNLAVARLKQQDLDKALTHVERAMELSPGNPKVSSTRGLVELEQGRLEEALATLRDAAAAAPDDPAIHYRYATALHRKGNDAGARQELESALSSGRYFLEIEEAEGLLRALGS